MVHTVFGFTLMAAGAARMIEIAFVLRDRNAVTNALEDPDPNSFQYLTPFLLIAGGFMFMGATEEQMQMLSDANVTHVAYVLILFSIAFLMFLCKNNHPIMCTQLLTFETVANLLIHLYAVHSFEVSKNDAEAPHVNGNANGYARVDRMARDAEEFELEGLTDDEDDDEPLHKEGRTNGRVAL